MKATINILVPFILALVLMNSCQKDVDNVKFPEFKLKLVVSGYLCPNVTSHYISVSTNQRIYGTFRIDDYPRNITSTLSDGDKQISLRPVFKDYPNLEHADSIIIGFVFNSSELSVSEGKTYSLIVESDEGLYSESSCTVPYRKNLFPTLDTVRFYPYVDSRLPYLTTNFTFTDIPDEENYYALLSELTSYYSVNNSLRIQNADLVDRKFSCLDDKKMDGLKITIPLGNIPANGFSYYDSTFLKIFILNTDRFYYDYHKSINNYASGEDPFTEASPIYSNIKGGLGIFAAYTCDSIIVRLK